MSDMTTNTRSALIAAAALLALSGCGASSPPDTLSDIAIQRIEAEADAGNCSALQREFDTADSNGNNDAVIWIYDVAHDAGCPNFP